MRNLLDEAPIHELHGRALRVAALVRPGDLYDRDVLDIGCGFGSFLLHAQARGARATGLEVSDQALATARRHVNGARLTVGSATALPFQAGSFDTVTAWDVIEHVPAGSEPIVLAEAVRVLRPGGVLYLSTPYAALAAKLTDPAWPLGHRHYRKRDLYDLATGFEVTDLEAYGGVWSAAYMLDLYVAKWVFRRRPFFDRALLRRVDAEVLRPGWWGVLMRAVRRT